MEKEEKNVAEILKHLKRWELQAGLLRTVHIIVGILAIVCSLLVAAKINSIDKVYIEWFAFIAALSIGIQNGFDLGNKANRIRKAWRFVNWSYLRYKTCDEHNIQNLVDDYKIGEEIVGDVKEFIR